MRTQRESGVALVTVLLILFLVSALVVGMSWMVMSDQRLGGNNQSRETAFYGAEAGMEKLTSDMGNFFVQQGSVTAANIATVTAPGFQPVIPGVTYVNAAGASTYTVGCPNPLVPCVAPVANNATIRPPSPYSGMSALITDFTLQVAAQSNTGAEVKLQRQIQLVAIPVFQFGIYSNTDLAFFNGPPMDFGGRVHTNGNLWLASNNGPLYFRDKITVSGQVIRSNLENGQPTVAGGGYGGPVTISLFPNPLPAPLPAAPYTNAQWRALGLNEGSMLPNNAYQALSGLPNNPTWTNTVVPAYGGTGGMLTDGVVPLNLVATALGGLATPVALIHRPVVGEQLANPAQFNQRYFSNTQASLRILLDDYGAGGVPTVANACNASPMTALDTISPGAPIDLATLAYDKASGFNFNAGTGKPIGAPWYTGLPLPLSNGPAGGANYNAYAGGVPKDGYWQAKNTPIITGCIKIEYVAAGAAAAVDVTQEILNLGVTGRNIYPQTGVGAANELLYLPNTGTVAGAESATCGAATDLGEPSPNAVIRITRLRDNPSTAYAPTNNACVTTQSGYDYWPMVLYDTREGIIRDNALPNNANDNSGAVNNRPEITAEGVMNYVELDVNNLGRWFTKAIGVNGPNADAVGGYEVYFSDRRGNVVDPTAGVGIQTGSFGFNDIVNRSDAANGCPDGILDQPGEDFEGDGFLRTYGGVPLNAAAIPANQRMQSLVAGANAALLVGAPAMGANPNCAAAATPPSPVYIYKHDQEARQNPPLFFRRALKLQYGISLNMGGAACFGPVPANPACGVTIASENPVYIQGDYNNPGAPTGFTATDVPASVAADAVTLLSNNWNDANSFISPYDPGSRTGTVTTYRVAIIAGKGIPFLNTNAGAGPDYGTDGGLHNFLRYLEGWGANLYYQGSLVSFYYNRQANGTYKCCNTVYSPPTRVYSFDPTFVTGPQWLPPRTPTLRSINTIGFTQELNPNQ